MGMLLLILLNLFLLLALMAVVSLHLFAGSYRTITSQDQSHKSLEGSQSFILLIFLIISLLVKFPLLWVTWQVSNTCKYKTFGDSEIPLFYHVLLISDSVSLTGFRRLNNNSLSGPFPVSLANMTQLAFL